ncbi:interaptin isoform X2 [Octopus bimaculoides]|uniref:interaptin isoform X2 n=1 Tax=Octopus bimaculoides TaxID=37653 RepID=UPI00071D55E0|nr:interaptin isoform X2 [Octopus bimaculoides]|eukprot:XP_014776805.1 PREDICTED: interaptin-like [Octopus bimaculoides]
MRCEAYTKIPVDLVHKMIERQEISPQAGYKIIKEFRCKTEEFIQSLNKEFQIAKQEVHREITLRNKAEIEKLHAERRKAIEALQKKQGSREEMIKIQKEYEDKEKDLVIQLELKQEHDMYALNREFDLKKRKGLKDLEEELLNLVREESSLLLEKYEWLKEESERKQAEFQKIIENIATYENAVLEERHQKHQAMFEISNNQEVDYRYLLNKAVANQKGILQKLKQEKIITDNESDQFCTELHQELRRIKDEFSEKRVAKEKELHTELSLEKKRILEDLENKHNREIADLEAKFKQQNDLDELTRIIELKRTKSNQRIELMKTEISLDEKHVHALNELREKISQESIAEYEKALENMIRSMKKPECEDVVDGYVNNYRQDIQNLERKQQEERKEYTIKVNEKLSQKQKESLEQNEEEKESLERMSENRAEVVEELLKIQDSMSDENRKRILDEHEMQKMRFEKSLTLNKLRQQSLLEEKLAMKRKQKIDNLEKQQALEAKSGDTNTECGDANDGMNERSTTTDRDLYTPEIDEINLSSEIEEINKSLLKQREKAKQEQEEKLGETIARLNLEKAKQMCLLEEKARAIDGMNTMLMEDMRVNGDAESQKIIEEHTKKQQKLQQESEEKKKKFDEELTKKLEVRKIQRETTLTEKHEKEIRDVLSKAPNKTAAIIKKVVLMNKHILERERFINQMNVQLKQNIEELSQQSDIKIQTDLQMNEVKLILSLLAMNKIKREEIFKAIKIPVELKNLINEIQNSKNGSELPEERNSVLETKIHDLVVKNTESQKTNDGDNKNVHNARYLYSFILCCFA